ncbi:DUF2812 domain-containing protein [Paenibacillus glycanilyticus]|uniref:DUF2812 domain-containing protein n=1 Tax=Paenibacillus glycanilyticus TaxID=126569 RepID=A0ABQ6GJD2_9BACL|nr:DUF2812 domain-containing protein [Paenibacillus glycanilyticus]GLX70328.1 hypothetical protein MU1_46740 [Paenibacillus glycanilyticus]
MDDKLIKRRRLIMSWNYEKEEQWLNDLSREGLHFKKAGKFSSSFFARDESVRYTYRLDYQTGQARGSAKFQEYVDLYQGAGWEYVSSYGSLWHYFRREWQPGEEPQLYTDRESLIQFYKRLQRVMGIMLLANLVLMLTNMINLRSFFTDRLWAVGVPLIVLYLCLFAVLGYGLWRMQKKVKGLKL